MRPAVLGSVPILVVQEGAVSEDDLRDSWPGKVIHVHDINAIKVLEIEDRTAVVMDLELLCAGG